MENKISENQTLEPVFPEESGLIIEKVLEKYGLIDEQNKGIDGFVKSTSTQEKTEIFENLPGAKIAKLVRDYGEKKISLESFPILLEKQLGISEKDAQQITKDLEKTLLVFIKQAPVEETFTEEKEIKTRVIPVLEEEPEIAMPEKPKTPSKKDVYREPIE